MKYYFYLYIRKFIFDIYGQIPFTENQKILIKNFLFQFFPFFFKNTVTYKNWKYSRYPSLKKKSVDTNSNNLISLSINEVLSALNHNLSIHRKSSSVFSLDKLKVIDVIIPIYKDLNKTLNCIQSVLSAKNVTKFRLILINDQCPDENLTKQLRLGSNF